MNLEKQLCDLFLSDHVEGQDCANPEHRAALARRREGAPEWYRIERANDGGGARDFLNGEAIHCGAGLELQVVEHHDDDYGGYTLRQRAGVPVRYEVDGPLQSGGKVVLYAELGGHTFRTQLDPWMRFRWIRRD